MSFPRGCTRTLADGYDLERSPTPPAWSICMWVRKTQSKLCIPNSFSLPASCGIEDPGPGSIRMFRGLLPLVCVISQGVMNCLYPGKGPGSSIRK